jgi:uncharacterized transporter YbjL
VAAHLHMFFSTAPLAAIALALAMGYLFGKIRFGTFVLGPVAATLLVTIAIGQVGVRVSADVKMLAFALFIYALGYMIGPPVREQPGAGDIEAGAPDPRFLGYRGSNRVGAC